MIRGWEALWSDGKMVERVIGKKLFTDVSDCCSWRCNYLCRQYPALIRIQPSMESSSHNPPVGSPEWLALSHDGEKGRNPLLPVLLTAAGRGYE